MWGGGGEVGGRERGRGNILGKQSRAKIFWTRCNWGKNGEKMADRPVCGFRWKRHYENHKHLCRVLQARLHVGLIIPSSYSFFATPAVSCLYREHVHYTLRLMPRPSDAQTDRHTRLGGSWCTQLTVHSQSTGRYAHILFVHRLWVKSKRFKASASKAKQKLRVHVDRADQCEQCKTRHNYIFLSDTNRSIVSFSLQKLFNDKNIKRYHLFVDCQQI